MDTPKQIHDDSTTMDSKTQITEGGAIAIDRAKEKKLVHKLDLHIIPVVMLLYLLSFLDRVNIGNARLYGLEADLNLSSGQYQIAVSILFVTYILSELPSNLILKGYVRPSRWIAFITVSWGIIATLTGIVQSYAGLIVCRLLLGLVEGGLFPGCAIYLTFFYTKHELALRIGYLFVSAALAGACGGLLAYGIGFMDGVAGQSGWRWILILEGLPTIVLGIACWWILADEPETAYYLNEEEKEMILARRAAQTGQTDVFDWKDVRKGLKDWKVWSFSVGQFCQDTMLYGYSTFLPTIILGIRPESSRAIVQVLTIPCYALGAISYMAAARYSDWRQSRGPVVIVFCCIAVIGYALLISDSRSGVHFAGCFLVAMGLYVSVGIPLAWLPTNNPRYGSRTTATGLQLTIGNASGIMAPFLYPSGDGPRYLKGHAVTMALVALGAVLYGLLYLYFKRENRARAAGKRDAIIQGLNEEEIHALGADNPKFVFAA
ncbi:Putative major facilitator superfamily, MFS transporter superfamily [Septoria linicola]|uniref:Major facilitator superfamily, MFS transporter superfamily n=1 Tax=Septoria linicola TaxID=215465 RepID=A0A9Q9EPP9_9PEZI|nr:putative major facilitator superfamily, MFS transporter superfamily [Septoria linicola]USW58996.1 Putative major facilitator superfamily, MFS transporter superfamily [Septoria linicola]